MKLKLKLKKGPRIRCERCFYRDGKHIWCLKCRTGFSREWIPIVKSFAAKARSYKDGYEIGVSKCRTGFSREWLSFAKALRLKRAPTEGHTPSRLETRSYKIALIFRFQIVSERSRICVSGSCHDIEVIFIIFMELGNTTTT